MVIRTLFAIQRQSSPMARGDKHGHLHRTCHLETIKSDGMRRQNIVIRTLFGIKRQSSLMVGEGKHGHLHLFLPSKDNQVRCHAETKHGHPNPFCYPQTIKSDGMRRQNMVSRTLFGIQRQSSLMAREDKTWSSASVLLSRDNQVQCNMKLKKAHQL